MTKRIIFLFSLFALLLSTCPVDASAEIPLTVVRHGPTGSTGGQVQVRIDFSRPIIPLTTLSDEDRGRVLSFFSLEPAVDGHFRFLGTSTVVFEPEESLPPASRYTVTVGAGVTSIDGAVLGKPLTWSFTTPRINIWFDPSDGTGHVTLRPDISVRSGVALDPASLASRLSLVRADDGAPVPFTLAEDDGNAPPDEDLGMHRRRYIYHLRLPVDLERDTQYRIVVDRGLQPRRGNLPTTRKHTSLFRTYPPFRLAGSGSCGSCGPNLQTVPYLDFTNKPDWEEFNKRVTYRPAAAAWPFRPWGCDSRAWAVTLDDRLLKEATTYTVTFPAGLRDIYGQELENPGDVPVRTGPLTPRLTGPAGYQVISPNLPAEFAVKTAGFDRLFYRLAALEPKDILLRETLDEGRSIGLLLDRFPNERRERAVPPGESGRGRTVFELDNLYSGERYGAVLYSLESPEVACFDKPLGQRGILLRTDLGIYSQFLPTGGRIKVNRLTDGSPVPGTRITMYRSDELPRLEEVWDRITGERISEPGEPCAAGVTGEEGILILDSAALKACTKRKIGAKVINELYPPEADPDDILYDQERYGMANPPLLNILAEKDDDWTFIQTREYGVPPTWRFGVYMAWEGERPLTRGTIFSDRGIYRPGETVRMKGISRYILYGTMHTGVGSKYSVSVTDPRGRKEKLTEVTVSDFGTFTFDVPTKPGQPLGFYQVTAEGAQGNLRFVGSYRLAEFRAPEFVVNLETNRSTAVAGEPVRISWDGRYYFGAPMKGAPGTLNIVRSETVFVPEGRRDYRFGIPSWLEDRRSSVGGQVSSEKFTLDGEGAASAELVVGGADIPRPMIYRIFAEVEDVSRQTAAANSQVTILPDRRLVGIKLDRWIVQKKEGIAADIIVTDDKGKALPGIPLTVRLLRREWHSIQRERQGGRVVTERQQVLTEVQSATVTSAESAVSADLVPPTAGSYMVKAELSEAPDSGTAAATALWAAGDDYVPWEGAGEDRLEIVFDKKEYTVGDEAVALIRSPFRKSDIYLTLCRDRIFAEELISFEGGAYTHRFTVTEEMLPNAFVGAYLVNRGGPLVPVEEETGRHMEKIGFAPFRVEKSSRYLTVTVAPGQKRYRPGGSVEGTVQVRDHSGTGRRSELTVMVVDESVLALTGYRPPDLVKVVHADRGLSVRINDNRPFLISRAELLQKGQGYGGGLEKDGQVRRRFLRLAHFEPSLVTDGEGKATYRFTLPDNLTTFRIMVVAVGEDDLFGYGDETITVTQPFLMRTVFPRYTRVGDSFLAGVGVTNLSGADGTVDIKAQIVSEGENIRFAEGDGRKADAGQFLIREGESTSLLFPMKSLGSGGGRLRFTASFSGMYEGEEVSERDSLEAIHTVRPLLATETVVAVGETVDEALQQISVGDGIRSDTGGLRLSLASSALSGLGESASYLVHYPYGCLEQTVSRLLALMELRHLSEKYGFNLSAAKPLERVIEANVRKVLAMQNWDGGFKFWPTSEGASCWLSPYVARLFARMGQLDYEVPEDEMKQLKSYLHKALRNPCIPLYSWQAKAEYRIRILRGLAWLGESDQSWFEEYFSKRSDLSYGAQIALASLLHRSPGWKEKGRIMADEIMNGLFLTGRTAHFEDRRELPPSWTFLYSPVITTAEGLKLLLELDPESELTSKMARYILDARVNGRWRTTYENSRALDALVEFSLRREEESPDFHAEVRLAGKAVMEEVFSGHSTEERAVSIPVSELPRGTSGLTARKEGDGRLHYTFSFSYRLSGPQPARNEGFTVRRIVRDWETKDDVAIYGEEAPPGTDLRAGRVYEVELEFKVPQTGYHFVLDDSLPAGLEPIDTSLRTTSGRYDGGMTTDDTREGDYAQGFRFNPFNHKELRDDGAGLFADAVRPGLYRFRYLARATSAGTFLWPGARASLMYEPEQFGTCSEGTVRVLEDGR